MSELGSSVGDDGTHECVWYLETDTGRRWCPGGRHYQLSGPPTPARPVSPVVPDSDGEVQPLALSDDERAGLLTALDELHGSGVVPDKPAPDLCVCADVSMAADPVCRVHGWVPDKPALAPEPCKTALLKIPHFAHSNRFGTPYCPGYTVGDPVPAVTDDEAATKALAAALNAAHLIQDDGGHGLSHPDECSARAVLADLRSAGFLIVHHTKET